MALTRFKHENESSNWSPYRDLVNMQREVSRLFDGLFGDSNRDGNMMTSWSPSADVIEKTTPT